MYARGWEFSQQHHSKYPPNRTTRRPIKSQMDKSIVVQFSSVVAKMHKLQAHTHTGATATNVEKGKPVKKGYICMIPWYGGQADQNEIWVFRDQGCIRRWREERKSGKWLPWKSRRNFFLVEEVREEGDLWRWQCSVTWPEWRLGKYSFCSSLFCWYALRTFYVLYCLMVLKTPHITALFNFFQWECKGWFAGFFWETSNSQMLFWQWFPP